MAEAPKSIHSTSPPVVRFCKDCQHFEDMPDKQALCRSPAAPIYDHVYGTPRSCKLLRQMDSCGPEAKLFVAHANTDRNHLSKMQEWASKKLLMVTRTPYKTLIVTRGWK